ncbi:helix-turn-helix transcriptional regulator [Mucilaginibacter flavus]|uniref:helix-turn-helix transcriptional regulator n=1 Tax=Mucilaginibacter flavus TaxID=931504 RepID=UPI0025B34432|nr:YafY family protein [Mucilaginibacter flavus]MDN3580756.1 YafY family protein [Mucilaginibacter flavus]
MNRFDRLTAILIQLQSKRIVKAQEIADRFEISLRTVYRDLKSLEQAGVPLIGELGVGYSLVEGYKLPPVMFNREEAIAFQFAEKIVEKYADTANSEHYKSGMYKIKAVLKHVEKELVEDMAERIKVVDKKPKNPANIQVVSSLLASISEKKIIYIRYAVWDEEKKDQIVSRKIEPIGIFFDEGQWSIIAYCYHIKDYRHYRTERIHQITPTDEPFHKKHMTLNHFFDQVNGAKMMIKIVLNVDSDFAHYIQEQKLNYGFVGEEELGNNQLQWTFLAYCTDAFTRWFITFADHAKIVEPDLLRTVVKDYLAEISQNI